MKSGKLLIVIVIIASIATFAGMIAFVGQGNVRETQIFWTEKVQQTVVFEDIDGKVQLRGIKGVTGEPNPTLLSRTSFVYILTVINNGDTQHRLYIEGFHVETDLLEPGEQDTITVYPTEEGVYTYYDKRQTLEALGQIKIVSVVPSDEFQGIWRDLI